MTRRPADLGDALGTRPRRRRAERRRAVLACLTDRAGVATVTELATDLADEQTTEHGDRPCPDRLAVRLHHVDLPRLADAGLVEYDPRDRTVRRRADRPEDPPVV